jgi:hypothetical protein
MTSTIACRPRVLEPRELASTTGGVSVVPAIIVINAATINANNATIINNLNAQRRRERERAQREREQQLEE